MDYRIAVVPGDGIGTEIMDVCEGILGVLQQQHGFGLRLEHHDAGAAYFEKTGEDISQASFSALGESDAILLGAIGLPHIRHKDGTEISPHLRMRTAYGLCAGLRPVKLYPNVPTPLGDPRARNIDIMIVRESTEGLFASVGKGEVIDDKVARETLEITRATCEQLFELTFTVARQRRDRGHPGRVCCVDKANVFRSMAFFRKLYDETASRFDDIERDYRYVDAAALDMVRKPWDFDVMVMENMFGDIISDLGAGIVGGMGMAPCAEIGLEHGLFQPAHGSAPDIMGQGRANPTAMIVSAAMMLDWLAVRSGDQATADAGTALHQAVYDVYADGEHLPMEFGGNAGSRVFGDAVMAKLKG